MNGNSNKHSIKQYSLTGPFDLSNPTLEEEYIGPNGNIKSNIQQFAQGFAFSSDGTKMYITGGKSTSTSTAGGVYEFTLASPFDLSSTVTYEGEFAVGSEITKVSGIAFSSDGSKMFLSPITLNVKPEVGDFYFFPNYLMHCVYPFKNSNAERRSVSFNAWIDQKFYSVHGR